MGERRPSPDRGEYEDVRRKLLERGYLGGPIERFVLGDLGAAGPERWGLSRAGLKAALLGAPILGGLLCGAAAAANRPVLRAGDCLVLWLYFSVLAGAALFVLDLAAAAILGARARRRGARAADSLRASLLVGLPTLAYLVLIGWGRRFGRGLAADAIFLAAALLATLLVAWLAGIVSLAGIIGRTGEVPDRSRRRVTTLVLVLLPLAAATLLLRSVVERSGARSVAPTSFSAALPAERLLFVGVDGLDAALVQALEPRGVVAGLLSRMSDGAVFPLRRPAGREPAEVWTTVMTGMPAEAHGVRSAGSERLPGVAAALRSDAGPVPLEAALRFLLPARTVPTSGAARSVRTLWEIVDLKAPAIAVGWWASWPAPDPRGEPQAGYVVSDRVLAKLLSNGIEDRDTSPASLYTGLASRFPSERSALRAEFVRRFPGLAGDLGRIVWESFLIDAFHWRTGKLLMEDDRVRATFVYLPGLDILRGRLADRRDAPRALEAYVSWLDGLLSAALAPGNDRRALLVADPGRSATHGPEGFAVIVAGTARPRCVGAPITDLDVAPLALSLLGFPRSAEMPGRAPEDCLDLPASARTEIATYGRRGIVAGPQQSDYDPDMLERLRSLGYVR